MLVRSFACLLIAVSSFVFVRAQEGSEKTANTSSVNRSERRRDLPLAVNGIDLQFLIKELARDMGMNVVFDIESFRTPGRKTYIDLKNVSAREALQYLLAQEHLISEQLDAKTILVAARAQGTGIYAFGLGVYYLSDQLAKYFDVEGGILINYVRPDSPGAKAGLKAGDVIVEFDGGPFGARSL